MSYYFSPSRAAFYPLELKSLYEGSGNWPQDCYEVSEQTYSDFSVTPPVGKILASVAGEPGWGDDVDESPAERLSSADRKISLLTGRALKEIQILSFAVELFRDLPGDKEKILALKNFVLDLRSIKTHPTYPADIIWPEYP